MNYKLALALCLAATICSTALAGSPRVIYETGFEARDGYSAASPLRGQQGWQGEGSGGNGIVTDYFGGMGQQAYIGFKPPPAPKDTQLNLWHPLKAVTPDPAQPVWKFSVWMEIADSTNGEYDDFRWSAFNSQAQRLFTLDFENSTTNINFRLDDGQGFQPTGFTFNTGVTYLLEIWMDFARNHWIAVMSGQVVVDSQRISTTGAKLDLAEMDAVWSIRRQGAAGDNYMIFDDYRVTVEAVDRIPVTLEPIGLNAQGEFELYLHGERGRTYSMDVTSDFKEWSSLATKRLDDGYWFFTDTTSPDYPHSAYRAREVAP